MPTDDTTPADDSASQERLREDRVRWYHWPLILIDDSVDGDRFRILFALLCALVVTFFLREPIVHFAEGLVGK